MKLRIIKRLFFDNAWCAVRDTLDVADTKIAKQLIAKGYAVAVDTIKQASATPERETRIEAQTETRTETKTTKKKKTKKKTSKR